MEDGGGETAKWVEGLVEGGGGERADPRMVSLHYASKYLAPINEMGQISSEGSIIHVFYKCV